MSVKKKVIVNRLVLGGALLVPFLSAAAEAPAPSQGMSQGPGSDSHAHAGDCAWGEHEEPPGPPPPHGPPPMGPEHEGEPPPFLRRLRLTDDQQDKVFAIMHAAAPALRDQARAARKAREGMRDLVRSAQFSEGAAASLAQTEGIAEGQLTLLRARMEHDVYSVLTPEQLAQLAARRQACESQVRDRPSRP